jgi:hypothetical protein
MKERDIQQDKLGIVVSVKGENRLMSLQREGKLWVLSDDGGLTGDGITPKDAFVSALGVFDGNKAARQFQEDRVK